MATAVAAGAHRGRGFVRFVLHFFEMCIPMCLGFAVGDAIYFWAAGKLGYSDPFADLPVLSVVVVTFAMTAPMVAWMRYRGMPRQAIVEMAATMPLIGISLLVLGWLSILPMEDLAVAEHALMMPAMLVPMLARHEVYTSKHAHSRSR